MFVDLPARFGQRRLDVAFAILLALLALVARIDHLALNSLSEDESAKWLAIQEYRHGHFAAVNAEHPMMPKMLAWASLAAGEHWARTASRHGWPTMAPEGWLRLPNVLFGAATAAVLYLLCRLAMGITGSFAAGFFWAMSPLTVALNRLVKEETPLTFFILLACYLLWRAKTADDNKSTRRWLDYSACAFGLATASQYIIHLFGLSVLGWYVAGRRGLDNKPFWRLYPRMFLIMGLVFVAANPVILSPENTRYILDWLHHAGIRHTGYAFDGRLYVNFPSLFLGGVPWYFYLWMLVVKTPLPILVAVIVGSLLLLRDRKTVASCLFLALGVVQLIGLSLSGAKWMRYSLSLLPFLYLAAGYAVQSLWTFLKQRRASLALVGATAIIVLGWPLLELRSWAPYYSLYLSPIGGGTKNIARFFTPDEISEFDTREVAQQICSGARTGVTVASGRPKSMTYYLLRCGRTDIRIVPLYDPLYEPRDGDLIVLEPARRFFETQQYFDQLPRSGMPHREVQVGPVVASTIYLFQTSPLVQRGGRTLEYTRAQDPQSCCGEPNPGSTTGQATFIWQSNVRQQP